LKSMLRDRSPLPAHLAIASPRARSATQASLTKSRRHPIFSAMRKEHDEDVELLKTWRLPPSATMGSAVRARGILLELRARIPSALKKSLDLDAADITLVMPASQKTEFQAVSAVVSSALDGIEQLPVIPREIQDILTITTSERHRWLADGRLPSAGTRTVRLNGRARRITFHVFDPKLVEDILDRGAVEEWREEDAIAKAENRRRAAYQAKLTRSLKKTKAKKADTTADSNSPKLQGWEEFGRDGFLK